MLNYFDVIKAQSGVPVDDIWAMLWGNTMSTEYVITTYTGTLPATLTGTKAGYLHRYKVHGAVSETEECGERTENLYSGTIEQGGWGGSQGSRPTKYGPENPSYYRIRCRNDGFVSVDPNKRYIISIFPPNLMISVKHMDDSQIQRFDSGWYSGHYQTDLSAYYLCWTIRKSDDSVITLSEVDGCMVTIDEIPDHYIPYGYKLPLLSGSTPVDVYIGDDTLSTEEYVDSGTGKIYRMVGGVLTPVDPPVPFPQIPTSANSTTISWAGEGLAPSEVEFEYEKRR